MADSRTKLRFKDAKSARKAVQVLEEANILPEIDIQDLQGQKAIFFPISYGQCTEENGILPCEVAAECMHMSDKDGTK